MRTPQDAVRSVKRYMAEALGPEWEVRLWTDEGSFAPPIARVAEASPTLYASRRVATDITKALQVHCYQAPADSVTKGTLAAREVEQRLVTAIEVGVGLAWPRRIPLYDYDGVPDNEGSSERNTYDFLRVSDFSVNLVHDTDEPTVVIVVADLRVAWSQPTTVDVAAQTVNSLRVDERAS